MDDEIKNEIGEILEGVNEYLTTENQLRGWYDASRAARSGYVVYEGEGGKEVKVTEVTLDGKEPLLAGSEDVGRVFAVLRSSDCGPDNISLFKREMSISSFSFQAGEFDPNTLYSQLMEDPE